MTSNRDKIETDLAQKAGTIGALSAILDQINDDMRAYHPDMHPVVKSGLELAMTYKRVLMQQEANQAKAQRIAQGADA